MHRGIGNFPVHEWAMVFVKDKGGWGHEADYSHPEKL
jgi:hypothetical protein